MAKTTSRARLHAVVRWLLRPWFRLRLKDAVGIDGVSRQCYRYVGVVWAWHMPGYYQDWYDGPIHHIGIGFVAVYWHVAVFNYPSNAPREGRGIPRTLDEVVGESCDTCASQEGRHYCLLHSRQMKNMNITRCQDWTAK